MSSAPWWSWLAISLLGLLSLGLAIVLVWVLRKIMHMFDGL